MLRYVYDDAGMAEFGRVRIGRTCAVRSLAILTGYKLPEIWRRMWDLNKEHITYGRSASPFYGHHELALRQLYSDYGLVCVRLERWKPLSVIHHVAGDCICNASGHYVPIVSGILYDTKDSRFCMKGMEAAAGEVWVEE